MHIDTDKALEWLDRLRDGVENQNSAAERVVTLAMKAVDWRPIETAPKDGTEVLTFGPLKDGSGFYYECQAYYHKGAWPRWPVEWMANCLTPTHWQPLPSPPGDEL